LSQFSSLGLSGPILAALADEGYATPTPIQSQAIPPILEGRDLLGCAQTGTGKTAAFALPILHRLDAEPIDKSRRGPALPRVLVLSPTRELATQIGDSFASYGAHTGLVHAVIYGGVSQFHQEKALRRGVDILVATPGRLMDLMNQGLMNFSRVHTLVLDEADRMLDMGFIDPIRRISAALPSPRQTLLFSATMPPEIAKLAHSLLRNPVKISVTPVASAAPLIEQSVYMVMRKSKQALLEHMLADTALERALVFTRTKHGADRVSKQLLRAGVSAQAIHGNKSQNQRERALASFRNGRARVLVATDVAARGLDVDGITHVFNFDLPNEPEAYVHRIGRTGRAGATGKAISFCDAEERGFLRAIERLTGQRLPAGANLPDLAQITRAHEQAAAPSDEHEADRFQRRNTSPRPQRPTGRPHAHPSPRATPHSASGHSHPASHSAGPATRGAQFGARPKPHRGAAGPVRRSAPRR